MNEITNISGNNESTKMAAHVLKMVGLALFCDCCSIKNSNKNQYVLLLLPSLIIKKKHHLILYSKCVHGQ